MNSTTDYEKFVIPTWTRDPSDATLKKLRESFDEIGNKMATYPIVVKRITSGKLLVLDGQCRLAVAKEKGEPVFYKEAESGSLGASDVAFLSNWTLEDVLTSYAKRGKPTYRSIKSQLDAHRMPISGLRCFMDYTNANKVRFRSGSFSLTPEQMSERSACLRHVNDMRGVLGERALGGRFIIALKRVMASDGYDPNHMLRQLIQNKGMISRHVTSSSGYEERLRAVYNYQCSGALI